MLGPSLYGVIGLTGVPIGIPIGIPVGIPGGIPVGIPIGLYMCRYSGNRGNRGNRGCTFFVAQLRRRLYNRRAIGVIE